MKRLHSLSLTPWTAALLFITNFFTVNCSTANDSILIGQDETYASPKESPVDRTQKLAQLSQEFSLADGAAWDGNWALYIPDVKGQKLYRYIPKTKKTNVVLKDAGRISATFFSHGRLYLSDNGNQQISFLQNGQKKTFFDLKTVNDKLRPNDLVVDNQGGIYVTFTPQNQVHYIDVTGRHSIAIDGIKTPNGITLSPDGQTLYVSSFVPKEIWSYTIPSPGKIVNGQKFATLPSSEGRGADGMAIDRAGNVLCTGPTGVTIWSPTGKLLDKIVTPSKPINCIFGDQDMRTLYISCFDGVYTQRMKISGRSPHPASAPNSPRQNASRPSTEIPDTVESHLDVSYVSYGSRKVLMDIFIPHNAENAPAVLVVHGGGWLKGDKTKFRALAVEMAKNGMVAAAIEYRLGHEARFPAAIHDCYAAVRFLRANAQKYRLDPQRIGAIGGSAGGHLVGLMAAGSQNKKLTGPQGNLKESSAISAAIVLAGPMQMATGSVADRSRKGGPSNSNIWIGSTVNEAKDTYFLADAYEQMDKSTPPLLFMAGEFDQPERNAPSREKLKSLGIPTGIKVYKGGKHGCWNQLPWFKEMSQDMVAFMQEHLK